MDTDYTQFFVPYEKFGLPLEMTAASVALSTQDRWIHGKCAITAQLCDYQRVDEIRPEKAMLRKSISCGKMGQ
jgi:hypothetical protein